MAVVLARVIAEEFRLRTLLIAVLAWSPFLFTLALLVAAFSAEMNTIDGVRYTTVIRRVKGYSPALELLSTDIAAMNFL
jgi:hypothetical protein